MRWALVLVGIAGLVWLLVSPGGDEAIERADPQAPALAERAPALLGARQRPAEAVTPTRAPGAAPAEAETPPKAEPIDLDITIHGVVKKKGSDEILADAQVLGTTFVFETLKAHRMRIPTESGGSGRFTLRVTDQKKLPNMWYVLNEGWIVADWQRDDDPGNQFFDPISEKKDRYEVTIWVREVFRLRGQVVDDYGSPIEEATIEYMVPQARGGGHVMMGRNRIKTGVDGRFEAGPFPGHPELLNAVFSHPAARKMLHLTVRKEGLVTKTLDPFEVAEDRRDEVRIVLSQGATWSGTLVDSEGTPLPGVVVEMSYEDDARLRRAVTTDSDGRWELAHLTHGKATLLARVFDRDAKARRSVDIQGDDPDVRLVAEPLSFHAPEDILEVFGLELVDVDDSKREAFELPDTVHVMVWDPGEESERLNLGILRRGCGLWMVGQTSVVSVAHAVQLLNERDETDMGTDRAKRVVYTYWRQEGVGSNTQFLRLTPADRADLVALHREYESRYPKRGQADEAK